MSCAVCQGKMIEKYDDIDMRINGKLYIVHHVHFEECDNCGERVLTPEVSEAIYEGIHQKHYREEKIEIPVLDLAVNM
ncbi:MAG: YgiT-type zinc finger protein [bacterium]|nr:YgiT-type zinc finger protein [bacterium]